MLTKTWFDWFPLWVLFVLTVLLVLAAIEGGHRLARFIKRNTDNAHTSPTPLAGGHGALPQGRASRVRRGTGR